MKKILLLSFSLLFSFAILAQEEKYSKVRIDADQQTLVQLAELGIPLEGEYRKNVYLITDLSESQIELIDQQNITYEVLIPDVQKFYQERNKKFENYKIPRDAGDYPVPEGWELGTMGGMYTFDQVKAELDTMHMLYPNLITPVLEMDSTSIQGRPIYYVKISDNPNINEDEPEVLYTGLHHAREGIGPQLLIYYMYYLLEHYEDDPEMQYIVNSTEMYFVPVINPDGYVYNETTNPNGGGMWRKNRRNNGGSYGVDLNRNYGYQWGYDNNGSSPDPWDDTYRGAAPFSEPETQAIREFCINHEFKMALNYHSYSDLLLYTWGWTEVPCPDDDILEAYAELMTEDNGYTYGPGSTTIYATNGGSDDWMYGEDEEKNRFFSYTPEVGGGNDGFWPAIDRIVPLCQENMLQNILAAKLAGKYAVVEDKSPVIVPEATGYFSYSIKRMGQSEADFTVSFEALNDAVQSFGDANNYDSLEIFEMVLDSISFELKDDIVAGERIEFLIKLDNGEFVEKDTISKVYGMPVEIFKDEGDDLEHWNGGWDITDEDFVSPETSITDSPDGNYSNNQLNMLTLMEYIDLENLSYAEMTFWAKWDIENGYDYVQLLISTDGGYNWIPLEGKYTDVGTGYQAEGEPVYDGQQEEWVKEYFDLSDYIGESIRLRFKLDSDSYIRGDGFYFDDLTVAVISEYTGVDNKQFEENGIISQPYPNPTNNSINFDLNRPAAEQQFIVYSAMGKVVHKQMIDADQKRIHIHVEDWVPGIYFYKLEGAEEESGNFLVY